MRKVFWLLFVLLVLFVVPVVFAQGDTPPAFEITALTLGSIIAALISLALDYFPGVAAWWDGLSVAAKRQLSAVFAVLIVAAVFGLTCANVVTSNLVCSTSGAWDAIANVIYVFVVGQGVHAGSKPTAAFKKNVLKLGGG